jgi:hypothetical protein
MTAPPLARCRIRAAPPRLASLARGLSLLLFVAAPAYAAPAVSSPEVRAPAPAPDPARSFCEYVTNVAASEGALLRAPWLFSSVGTLRGTSALDADATLGPDADRELSLRLQAGFGFSPTRYYVAGLLDDRATAECERHRAEEEVRSSGVGAQGVTASALTAKIAVLEQALPEAERLVRASLDALEGSRTTLDEHGALERRVDELRQRLADAELALAALPEEGAATSPPAGSFERLRRWTAREQAVSSSLRRAGALSLTLRGGYDELFGVPQELPVFGSVTLEFNPGWFWQPALDARAERAHAESVEADLLGRKESLAGLERRLRAELAILRRRRSEVNAALADLSRRRERLLAVGSAAAREYSEYVWFEQVRLRADAAFLDEQVRALQRLTGLSESAGE